MRCSLVANEQFRRSARKRKNNMINKFVDIDCGDDEWLMIVVVVGGGWSEYAKIKKK